MMIRRQVVASAQIAQQERRRRTKGPEHVERVKLVSMQLLASTCAWNATRGSLPAQNPLRRVSIVLWGSTRQSLDTASAQLVPQENSRVKAKPLAKTVLGGNILVHHQRPAPPVPWGNMLTRKACQAA